MIDKPKAGGLWFNAAGALKNRLYVNWNIECQYAKNKSKYYQGYKKKVI